MRRTQSKQVMRRIGTEAQMGVTLQSGADRGIHFNILKGQEKRAGASPAPAGLMLECPEAVGEVVPEDQHAGGDELGQIGGFDHGDMKVILQGDGDQADKQQVQAPADEVHE